MAIEDMIKQLDELLEKADALLGKDIRPGTGEMADATILANRLEAAITRMTTTDSIYRDQLKRASRKTDRSRFGAALQVAYALQEDLKAGWTATVVELVHADTYSDYLEMADALLAKGYKDPAAVITGTSLEVHVRALCVKSGVTTAVGGKPKKANTMNADLKKAGVYDGLQEKKITAWMDLRNKAAHGDYSAYDKGEVGQFIEGVRTFLMKFPA
ncbi:hypothetical protein [Streptomyces microflavus]|uniref:hypothetical protein n=1 Tax=Streptomyces microflavus TaxID=1919 RepID=UPI003679ACE9